MSKIQGKRERPLKPKWRTARKHTTKNEDTVRATEWVRERQRAKESNKTVQEKQATINGECWNDGIGNVFYACTHSNTTLYSYFSLGFFCSISLLLSPSFSLNRLAQPRVVNNRNTDEIWNKNVLHSHTYIHIHEATEWMATNEKKRYESEQQKICKIKVNFKKYINKDMVMDKPA